MKKYIALLTVFLAGCAVKPDVSWDYNRQVNWPAMTTWAWHQPNLNTSDPVLSLMAQRVRQQVVQGLAAKGLREVPADQASIWLSWGFTEQSKLENVSYSTPLYYGAYRPYGAFGPYGWGIGAWPSQVVTNSYEEGRLALRVINPVNNYVIWQGVASQRLSANMSPREQDEYITKSVNSLLAKFPPPIN